MRINFNSTKIYLLAFISLAGLSCKKYLDTKPDASLSTLSTLQDMQAFLDRYQIMNTATPPVGDMLADDYYMTSATYNAITTSYYKDAYIWKKRSERPETWTYTPILYANIVLDELPGIERAPGDQQLYERINGRALFFRGFYHYLIAELFAPPYNAATAGTDPGIPIRTTSDYNVPSHRSSVEETYQSIIGDIKASVSLLPDKDQVKTRPVRPGAFGALARIYLSMQQYDSALLYADKCLAVYDSLMDFNVTTADFAGAANNAPIKRFNREIVFHARSPQVTNMLTSRAKIDSNLYNSYDVNDWRKTVFFRANTGANAGTYQFKGDYDGAGTNSGYSYHGITTSEMFLIRSECYARLGNIPLAMQDLNKLLQKRWKTAFFTPVTASSQDDAINKILAERRKELFFRGARWSDLRRLMSDPHRAVTPKRFINNQLYELLPGSSDYVIRIPDAVIALTGMPQNP